MCICHIKGLIKCDIITYHYILYICYIYMLYGWVIAVFGWGELRQEVERLRRRVEELEDALKDAEHQLRRSESGPRALYCYYYCYENRSYYDI